MFLFSTEHSRRIYLDTINLLEDVGVKKSRNEKRYKSEVHIPLRWIEHLADVFLPEAISGLMSLRATLAFTSLSRTL